MMMRNEPFRQSPCGDPLDRPYVVIPNEYCENVLKTFEGARELRRRIEEKVVNFDRAIAELVEDMRRQEADVMASQKAERVSCQLAAYINSGLSEEKAWELVKLEAQNDGTHA